jgi:hypothetical protein
VDPKYDLRTDQQLERDAPPLPPAQVSSYPFDADTFSTVLNQLVAKGQFRRAPNCGRTRRVTIVAFDTNCVQLRHVAIRVQPEAPMI